MPNLPTPDRPSSDPPEGGADPGVSVILDNLQSLEDIKEHVRLAYQMAMPPARVFRARLGLPEGDAAYGGPLPEHVAKPARLMARAIELSGDDGMSRQELLALFDHMGKEKKADGLKGLQEVPEVVSKKQTRPNKSGRQQQQTVFYWQAARTSG